MAISSQFLPFSTKATDLSRHYNFIHIFAPINCTRNISLANSTFSELNGYHHKTQSRELILWVVTKPLTGEGRSRRREIIVTNERSDLTSITLWGDFAENDGELLEKMKYDKPILGFCDVRVSIYKGNFGISTIPEIYHKFKAKITDIINKDEPWYSSCKKCFKKVDVIKDTATCGSCNIENVDYESRYCLRIEVSAGERRVRVILFDAAEYLFGCDVKEYIQSICTKKEESNYYRKLVLSKDKEFIFLVKIDNKNKNSGRILIAQEIHEFQDVATIKVLDEDKPAKIRRKRSKRNNEDQRPISNKRIKVEKN
ncbi:hypothetical protein A4A49_30234 [Nicotiana attenuata]|uniref:Replication factor A C-terminal domain-containing protein n=1 Tax=Nicotiana attenuata TaxID=49451 RepID=A0A1J6IT36_NICAT|nr:hypothetical protein A4A49_30234 [Nicotiana attenuata]